MRHRLPTWMRLAAGLTTGLLVLACGEADPNLGDPEPITEPATDPDDDDAPDDGADADPPTVEPGAIDSGLDGEVAAAVTDAAARAGVDPDAITVLVAERVEWSDGSLGCPEPGMMYTQAIVPGYRVVLDAAGDQLHYHGADGQPPAWCEEPATG